jgi:hypothetical protein
MLYFIQQTKCQPSFEMFGFVKIDENTYTYKDGSIWKTTKLYDLGWGRENGLYRTPLLNYSDLLNLFFNSSNDKQSIYNYWGAVSTLIDLYYYDFLRYLIDNSICISKQLFEYLDSEFYCEENVLCKINKTERGKYLFWNKMRGAIKCK